MREEYQQRLAKEYRYAATKMQEAKDPIRKLFYFSVLFGEAQRVLNWEWDTDLALIHVLSQHIHTQINATMQMPGLGQTLPIDWATFFDRLTQVASDLATYFEEAVGKGDKEKLYKILGYFAEMAYAVSGNGSYLLEKGAFKL
jgi:hypothetical protein